MLTENFQLSEVQHYRLLSLAVSSPNKRKSVSANANPLNTSSMNAFKKITQKASLKLLLILLISVVQINSVYSFANVISLTASCESYSDETIIRLENQATFAFDADWDAYKLSNGGNTPNFYSVINNEDYTINSFPGNFDEYSLDLNLEIFLSGNYTITAKSLLNSSFACTYTITLEDKFLNTNVVLGENVQYTFQATTSDTANRFTLHYKNSTSPSLTTGLKGLNSVNQYVDVATSEQGFSVNFKNVSSEYATVNIVSMDGKEVYLADNISTQSSVTIPINGSDGRTVYIIKVVVENTVFDKKIVY